MSLWPLETLSTSESRPLSSTSVQRSTFNVQHDDVCQIASRHVLEQHVVLCLICLHINCFHLFYFAEYESLTAEVKNPLAHSFFGKWQLIQSRIVTWTWHDRTTTTTTMSTATKTAELRQRINKISSETAITDEGRKTDKLLDSHTRSVAGIISTSFFELISRDAYEVGVWWSMGSHSHDDRLSDPNVLPVDMSLVL